MSTEFTKQNGGGMKFVGGGVVQDLRPSTNRDTGEVKGYGCNVAYMGGKQFVKLTADTFDRLRDGVFVTFEASVRTYKDNTYPADFRILTIDGKSAGAQA